jgi:hypothetical protein
MDDTATRIKVSMMKGVVRGCDVLKPSEIAREISAENCGAEFAMPQLDTWFYRLWNWEGQLIAETIATRLVFTNADWPRELTGDEDMIRYSAAFRHLRITPQRIVQALALSEKIAADPVGYAYYHSLIHRGEL